MQLREMRFATITGTEVTVKVGSAGDAKAAIKELRHKKKDFAALGRLSSVFGSDDHAEDVERLEKDLIHMEEILHNIDSCIIQLEGRLLT